MFILFKITYSFYFYLYKILLYLYKLKYINMIKIYTLQSTRNLNEITYVGKTSQSLKRRLSQHLCEAIKAKKSNYKNNKNYNWINQELDAGYEIVILEIDELDVLNSDNWEWLENYWISQIKTWGFSINNLTSGGDGNKNQVFSKESIEKRAKKIRGVPRPQKVKDKISKSHLGKSLSDEHKHNVSEAIINLQGKSINQYDKQGNFIKTWRCVKEAAIEYNADSGNIIKCCKRAKNHNFCAGFIWRYTDDETPVLSNMNQIKYVYQYDLDLKLLNTWESFQQMSTTLNIPYNSLYHGYKKNGKYKNWYIKYE